MWRDLGTIIWVFYQRLGGWLSWSSIPKKKKNSEYRDARFVQPHSWSSNLENIDKSPQARMQSEYFWKIRLGIVVTSGSASWFVTHHISIWIMLRETPLKLKDAWCRDNIRMVNKYGKLYCRLRHDLSISSYLVYPSRCSASWCPQHHRRSGKSCSKRVATSDANFG